MDAPLAGLRVLAVEQYGAGPFGTQLLSDLGAEVIKIENRNTGGDYARALGPYFIGETGNDDASLFFQSINRNKKSISLDLKHPEGRAALHKLVAQADAVANNLRGDVPKDLGLTHDALSSFNPKIVCAHCSGYGRTGPRASWPGYDYLMQARTGCFSMSGEPDTPPARMGLSMIDFLGGTYMALGLLAGVIGARSTGKGRDIDVTLFDAALSSLCYLGAWTLNSDYAPARVRRSAHPSLVPCQLYRTADGWIYIMCNKEKFWPILCDLIGCGELARDPEFSSFDKRLARRDALTEILDTALQERTSADWLERLDGKVPCAPIRTPREALTDPELAGSGRVETLELADGTPFQLLSSPFRSAGRADHHACPPLGANTRTVLRAAGLSDPDIDHLFECGAI
ncbi:CaiB/BaiF CoA-transferase family protein [Roseibium sp. RKSG952]|uniref:CaiB/BaiF CoA transferase family protein n=1 Tax=Roseibium sp. RKSG952 TaxID=2529384 RepID=UPI0012BD5D95|nr:CoA transferase [Roseibium sp. RKSG952]MTH95583.1 CoA transferase [Roseibium sp. RKSG952]